MDRLLYAYFSRHLSRLCDAVRDMLEKPIVPPAAGQLPAPKTPYIGSKNRPFHRAFSASFESITKGVVFCNGGL